MPRFSIVIPCFNASATLGQTLASLAAQTCTDWEAICVDDGSTDPTRDILHAAARRDPRIVPICNTGKGPSSARNMGALKFARGDLIAFCDADDLWGAGKLAALDKTFANASVHGAYGLVAFFNQRPEEITAVSSVPAGDLSIAMLLGENPVCTMSNLTLRRGVFAKTGGFDTSMVHNEDLEFLIRLIGLGARVVGLPELQTWYRASTSGLSADLQAMRAGRARALATAAGFGVVPSRRSHAVFSRYLARRALRLGQGRFEPLAHAMAGLAQSPAGFLTPLRRGGPTLAAALATPLLPRGLRRALFSR